MGQPLSIYFSAFLERWWTLSTNRLDDILAQQSEAVGDMAISEYATPFAISEYATPFAISEYAMVDYDYGSLDSTG